VPGPPKDPQFIRSILDHLRAYPVGLTAYSIARVLGLSDPKGHGATRVRAACAVLAAVDLARSEVGPKEENDHRPTTRWWPA
jgi:hypothetical protein